MKFQAKVALLILLTYVCGCSTSNPQQAEIESYLVSYWETALSSTTNSSSAQLDSVAAGEELARLQNARNAFQQNYDIPLVSAQVLRILEHSETCFQVETRVTYGGEKSWEQGRMHEYMIFLKKNDLWKVVHKESIVSRSEFTSTDRPSKDCADFEK